MVTGIQAAHRMPSRAMVNDTNKTLEGLATVQHGIKRGMEYLKWTRVAQQQIDATGLFDREQVAELKKSKASIMESAEGHFAMAKQGLKTMGVEYCGKKSFRQMETWVVGQTHIKHMDAGKQQSLRADAFAALKRDFAIATTILGLVAIALTTANLIPVDFGKAAPVVKALSSLPARIGAGAVVLSGAITTGVMSGIEKREAKEAAEHFVAAHEIGPERPSMKMTFEQGEAGPSVMKAYSKIRPATDDPREAVDTLKPQPTAE